MREPIADARSPGPRNASCRDEATFDRIARFVLGVMLLGLYGALATPWKYLTLAGLLLIATAITGRCPLYSLLGFSTCRRQEGAHS